MFRRNAAGQSFGFRLLSKSGDPVSGASVSAYRCIDDGAQAAVDGSISSKGNGQYVLAMDPADCDGRCISFVFAAAGTVGAERTIVTDLPVPMAVTATVKASPTPTATGFTVTGLSGALVPGRRYRLFADGLPGQAARVIDLVLSGADCAVTLHADDALSAAPSADGVVAFLGFTPDYALEADALDAVGAFGFDFRESLRLVLAAVVGRSTGPDFGTSGNVVFKDPTNAATIITYPVNAKGYRTGAPTLNPVEP